MINDCSFSKQQQFTHMDDTRGAASVRSTFAAVCLFQHNRVLVNPENKPDTLSQLPSPHREGPRDLNYHYLI